MPTEAGGMRKKCCQALRRSAAALPAVVLMGCFGTGVMEADRADFDVTNLAGEVGQGSNGTALSVPDVQLTPPAPASQSCLVKNTSANVISVDDLSFPAGAGLSVDTSDCPTYPLLAPMGECSLSLRAATNAVVGSHAFVVRYRDANGWHQSTAQAIVVAGPVTINDGQPIRLAAVAETVAIQVRNDGFDVNSLNLDLPWNDQCGGITSLTLDTSNCAGGLAANASCTLLLATLVPNPGYGTQFSAGGGESGAVASSVGVSVTALRVAPLAFTAPGTLALQLENLGTTPLSITDVNVAGGNNAGLLAVGNGVPFGACQDFVGTCQLSITADASAYIQDGAGVVDVGFVDGFGPQKASASLQVGPGGPLQSSPNTLLTLAAGPDTQSVTLTNTGPFAWVGPTVALDPPLVGVTVNDLCQPTVVAGGSCQVELVSSAAVEDGASAALSFTGANVASASLPVDIRRALLGAGQLPGNDGGFVVSYDDGNSWQLTDATPATAAQFAASVLPGTQPAGPWVSVGSEGVGGSLNQAIYSSLDRGQTWWSAAAPMVTGTLLAVAHDASGYVAVGGNAGGNATSIRTSADGNTWSGAVGTAFPGFLQGVASSSAAWAAVGADDSGHGRILTSLDHGLSWQNAAIPAVSVLNSVAYNGAVWLAVGYDLTNHMAALVSVGPDAQAWSLVSGIAGTLGSLQSVLWDGAKWVVSGTTTSSTAEQIVLVSTDAGASSWSPPVTLGPGSAQAITYNGSVYLVAGSNGPSTQTLYASADGIAWQLRAPPAGIRAVSYASRF